ncbi:MAG: aminopeptidase [Fusobacteria bacterium]|nr:aminopeptidase [Fusobacteriota bacterium]
MKLDILLEKYAEITLKVGINLQKGQTLIIRAIIENAQLVRVLVKKAYELGAGNVIVDYSDEKVAKIKAEIAPEEALSFAPSYVYDAFEKFAKEGAAFLSISSSNPDLFAGCEGKRVAQMSKSVAVAMQGFREHLKKGSVSWNIIAAASPEWATKVYPKLKVEDAVEKLWKDIFKIARVDQENPIKAWDEHISRIQKNLAYLNSKKFKKLHYTASNGTDIILELPEKHLWQGGAIRSTKGVDYVPNIPTEEVFTLPSKNGVDGIVYGSKPLNYNGNLIDQFWLKFEKGKIVEYDAKIGKEALANMITLDEFACFLGEVALVPYSSPISDLNTIFYNILIDENASCHFAVGSAYPMNVVGGTEMNADQLKEAGANLSMQHVDFMIGTSDLSIDGELQSGETITIFKNGDFAIYT